MSKHSDEICEQLVAMVTAEKNKEVLDDLYRYYKQIKSKKETKPKTDTEKKNKPCSKQSKKYKLLLEFVNKLLTNIDKDPVADLKDFKNIDRIDIIKEENKTILTEMTSELFGKGPFSKKACNYGRKTESWVLNVFRGMVKQAGFQFVARKKEMTEPINGVRYKRTHMLYTIV